MHNICMYIIKNVIIWTFKMASENLRLIENMGSCSLTPKVTNLVNFRMINRPGSKYPICHIIRSVTYGGHFEIQDGSLTK